MDPIELIAALDHPNVKAFLWMLRHGEGTQDENGFRRMFGGELFDSFADHPRKVITKKLGGTPISSTAAGAPQFLARTWDALVKQYGFADFSPKNQELGAVALIKGRKALDDVIAGRFEQAVMKCNKEWASLPGSPYGQPVVTMARARKEYEEAGGTYAESTAIPLFQLGPEPTAGIPPNPFVQQEAPMAPFLLAALPALIDLVPKLGPLFSSGSAMSERNLKAAELVMGAAKEAIGAANEQELVETLKNDPEAAELVRKGIEGVWFQLQEVGGGIAAAREANAKAAGPGGEFWRQPAFWITVMLLPLVYGVVWQVLTGNFPSEVQSMVVSAVVTGVLSGVLGFWMGTSFSSQKKTDALIK